VSTIIKSNWCDIKNINVLKYNFLENKFGLFTKPCLISSPEMPQFSKFISKVCLQNNVSQSYEIATHVLK
jgi:hypothetical protein